MIDAVDDDARFGIDEEEAARRLAFLGFIDLDAALVREAGELLTPLAEELATALYARIREEPSLTALIDEHLVPCRIKQSTYLRQLFAARIDRLYTISRAWVGEVHRQFGVEPRWYVAACGVLLETLASRLAEHPALRDDPGRGWAAARSLTKLFFFDMVLALDTYDESRRAAASSRDEVLSELAAPAVLEVWPGVLVLPLVGNLDARRGDAFLGALLQALARARPGHVILRRGAPAADGRGDVRARADARRHRGRARREDLRRWRSRGHARRAGARAGGGPGVARPADRRDPRGGRGRWRGPRVDLLTSPVARGRRAADRRPERPSHQPARPPGRGLRPARTRARRSAAQAVALSIGRARAWSGLQRGEEPARSRY